MLWPRRHRPGSATGQLGVWGKRLNLSASQFPNLGSLYSCLGVVRIKQNDALKG